MKLRDFFRREPQPAPRPRSPIQSMGEQTFRDLNDPALLEFLRGGNATDSGAVVSTTSALQNMAVLRSVSLICNSIGMLPLQLFQSGGTLEKAKAHPLYRLLATRPNNWQTAMEFKSTVQLNALTEGNGYARIVRSGERIIRLVPLESSKVVPRQNSDWSVDYEYQTPGGRKVIIAARDMFHLRDLSIDGVAGMSRMKMAKEAIGLALEGQKAAAKLFSQGMQIGGWLAHPKNLSDDAYKHLRETLEGVHAGADNAHRWMIAEEGMTPHAMVQSFVDSQHVENRNLQIQEIARAFGVPRPLLMMDDTSWGSGIEQLGIFFIQYTLAPWFTAWEQAISRSLLSDDEIEEYYAKFNERALLRGTLKDQADFFAKALGSGGHYPWMQVNEVRDLSELPRSDEPHAGKLQTSISKGGAE